MGGKPHRFHSRFKRNQYICVKSQIAHLGIEIKEEKKSEKKDVQINDFSETDEVQLKLAQEYDSTEDYERALKIFMPLAQKGNLTAQNAVGDYYEFGLGGLKQNIDKALVGI